MLVVAAAGMIVAGGLAYAIQRERTLAQIDDRLLSAVDETSFIGQDAAAATLNDALTAIVQRLRPGTDEATFALVDGATAIVPGGDIPLHPERDAAFVTRIAAETAGGDVVRGTAVTSEGTVRYVAIPVTVVGETSTGVFVVAVDLSARMLPIDEAFRTFAIVAALALVALGLVGWFVSGRLLAPIRQLRLTAARITASDPGERIDVVGTDDVSDLTVTVNSMLDRLEGAISSQRQLLDDVGHELKTPITIVRGHLELMDPASPAEVAATRDLAIDELDRMGGLVRDISELAGLRRTLRVQREPTDVAALVEAVRVKASALSSDYRWTTTRAANEVVLVDPDRLTQALLQLATNAVTHGNPTGHVDLSSTISGDRLVFTVSDDGPGIDAETARTVFERFRRGTTGRGVAGSGLGLAIVAAITEAHGGRVSVASLPGEGSRFTLDLPLIRTVEGAPS